jgi:hypothetical protein
MRYLITLVTPPNGAVVLDPFAGSGTTGVACAQLGVPCVLIEMDPEYCEIIARRVDHALDEYEAGVRPKDGSVLRGGVAENLQRPARQGKGTTGGWADYKQEPGIYGTPEGKGRWPANVILDRAAADALDAQSGELRNGGQNATTGQRVGMFGERKAGVAATGYAGDTGGASRFFKTIDDDDDTLAQIPLFIDEKGAD